MDTVRYEHRHLDVACELDEAQAGARVEEWRRLRNRATRVEAIAGGARLRLRPDDWVAAQDLAGREAACCGFLDIDMARDNDSVRLDVTSAAPSAGPLIACLVGIGPCPCCS